MALPPIAALEIGTTNVVAIVGEMRDDGHIVITGRGVYPSAGVRKAEVTDFDNACGRRWPWPKRAARWPSTRCILPCRAATFRVS